MMKVGLISFLYDKGHGGGASAVVESLAKGLHQLGHEVFVITTGPGDRVMREMVNNIPVYRIPPANLYWIADKDQQPTWKKSLFQLRDTENPTIGKYVRDILLTEQPDVVNVHKLRGLSPSVWTAARRAHVPALLQTCHDYELMSPEGTLTGRIGQWSNRKISPVLPYQKLRARRSQLIDCVTCPSSYTLNKLTRHGFFPHAQQRIIRNSHGFSQDALTQIVEQHTEAVTRSHDEFRLLYLGRLEANKGVDWLCNTVTQFSATLPNLHLDIAGWGTLETNLRNQHREDEKITFHGTVMGDQKRQLIRQADVLVVPSVYEEISPVVISEAYAFGKPVIATDLGGLAELIEPEQTGWLVPARDSQALGETLALVAKTPGLARQMSTACLRAAQQFTLEAMVTGYLTAYHDVLQRREAFSTSAGVAESPPR